MLGALFFLAIIAGVVWYRTDRKAQRLADAVAVPSAHATVGASVAGGFSCTGKRECSQMSSCDEARFYIAHCPDTRMDGDGDGVPCESRWCGVP